MKAEAASADLPSFATTLQVVIANEQNVGRLQIGDGATVVAVEDDLRLLTRRSDSEFVNETHFITGVECRDHADISVLPNVNVTGIAVFSDGVTPLCVDMAAWKPHQGFFAPLFQHLRSSIDFTSVGSAVESLLDSPDAHSRSDDDRTIVLAFPTK